MGAGGGEPPFFAAKQKWRRLPVRRDVKLVCMLKFTSFTFKENTDEKRNPIFLIYKDIQKAYTV